MKRPARLGLGVVSLGAYVAGLAVAGLSTLLALVIGPLDGFAATMILAPGAVGLAGAAGTAWAAGRAHRRTAIVLLAGGAVWVGATIWVVSLFAVIGR